MKGFTKTSALTLLGFILMLGACLTSPAQQNRDRNTKKVSEAAKQSAKAARVFDEIMGTREKSIPQDLLDKAEAVAVFPSVFKAGFIVGGRGGSGVISRRTCRPISQRLNRCEIECADTFLFAQSRRIRRFGIERCGHQTR